MEKTHKQLKKEKTCEQNSNLGDCNWCDKLGYNCPTCDPTNTVGEFTPVLDDDTECHYCEIKLRPGDLFVYYAEHLIGDTHYLLFCRDCLRFGE